MGDIDISIPEDDTGEHPLGDLLPPPFDPFGQPPTPIEELREWLHANAADAIPHILDRAASDGGAYLDIMANAIQLFLQLDHHQAQQATAALYALGEASKVLSAIREGRSPDPRSWRELAAWAAVGERLCVTGKWL